MFRRIADRAHDLKGLSFKEVIKTDKKVFRLEDGTETKNLRQTFKALLKFADLLKCPKTGQDRVLYSLRHFYASQNVRLKRATMGHLATHMGTSIEMVEKYYGHFSIFDVKEDFKK